MNLLPKTHKDFGSKQYWNKFFSNIDDSFEWYGEYLELCSVLHKYMKPNDKILVAGCGNSTISADLYKHGFRYITNVDISEIAIKQMTKKYEELNEMLWLHGDLTSLPFEDGSFSCVLDKGTLDALKTDDSEAVLSTVDSYFKEMQRILRVGGRYICVSLLQEHLVKYFISWFSQNGWMIRVCRCEDAEKNEKFPVFVIICTKFKSIPGMKPVLELNLKEDINTRVESVDEIVQNVVSLQQYAILRHKLNNETVSKEDMTLELSCAKTGSLRYILNVVDAPKKSNKLKFAVFIVPQGREVEWLFGNKEGQIKLAESAGSNRLIVVHLIRGQHYESTKAIQDELSSKIVELRPPSLPSHMKIPFLSVGEDLGQRTEKFRSFSDFSGEFIIEDVANENDSLLRRLIFLNNQNIIQSEAKLIPKPIEGKKKKKNSNKPKQMIIDHSYLSCDHHLAMVSGIGLASVQANVLLIGLGGGPLATFIHHFLTEVHLTVVELDPAMLSIAKEWFGFCPDNKLKVEIDDGIDFINKSVNSGLKYDVIMFDVDSKDSSIGLSCPPKAFIEKIFLDKIASCLTDRGVFILNLVCRDETMRENAISTVKTIFPSIICQKIPEELNQILFCMVQEFSENQFQGDIEKIANVLKQSAKKDVLDVREIMVNIKKI